jgi:hypothetical protein
MALACLPRPVKNVTTSIQYEAGRYQLRRIPQELTPMADRGGMVLVVDGFERDEIACIEKDRVQP